jgi:hypothetical protein
MRLIILYSEADWEHFERISQWLNDTTSNSLLPPGEQNYDLADAAIILWSKAALESKELYTRISTFKSSKRPFLPIMLDDEALPVGLRDRQSLKLTHHEPLDRERVLHALEEISAALFREKAVREQELRDREQAARERELRDRGRAALEEAGARHHTQQSAERSRAATKLRLVALTSALTGGLAVFVLMGVFMVRGPENAGSPQTPSRPTKSTPTDKGLDRVCRLPEHGIEEWRIEETITGDTKRKGPREDPKRVCSEIDSVQQRVNELESLGYERGKTIQIEASGALNPEVFGPLEEPFEYRCTVVIRAGPIYQAARSRECPPQAPN